jgi:uncharacterized membrane protein
MTHKDIFYKAIDLVDVPLAFIGSMALMQIKEVLGIIALCLTIGYTIWKWTGEIVEKREKNKKKEL